MDIAEVTAIAMLGRVVIHEPIVLPDNNAWERSLRGHPLGSMVTSRKISGGTRSAVGSATKMTLVTLFSTWRLAWTIGGFVA